MPKLATAPKGFAKVKQPQTFTYRAEIKRRFLTDDSELDLGELKFTVPLQPTRAETHDLAILFTGCWLQTKIAVDKGANQAFLFTASDNFIERIEVQPFNDRSGCHKVPIQDAVKQNKNPLLQCRVLDITWEKIAK